MDTHNLEKYFFTLYEDEAESLFRFVSFRLSDREKSKDIVQESFFRLYRVLQDKLPENSRAYLYRIARNLVIDEYRKVKNISLDELTENGFDTEKEVRVTPHESIDLERALAVMKSLPATYSEALWLRMVEGWAVKDIAESLEVSENVVSVHIHRGLKAWRERMNKSK